VGKSLNIGPLALPLDLAVLIAAVAVALVVDAGIRKMRKVEGESPLVTIFLVAVVVARLAFVAAYFDEYRDTPLRMIDIRDGGFNVAAGVLAGLALIAWHFIRKLGGGAALVVSVSLGALTWALGTLFFTLESEQGNGVSKAVFTTLEGGPVDVASFSGKPVVINLWATWCPPCVREMPVLRDAQKKYQDVTFVFVNQGESHASVSAFLKTHGLELANVTLDPTMTAMREWNAGVLPTTLFLDAKGRVVDTRLGELSAATLSQRLEAIRAKR